MANSLAMQPDPVLAVIAAWTLGGVLLTAARHKLKDRGAFTSVLSAYRLLPDWSLAVAVPVLILMEAGTALALFSAVLFPRIAPIAAGAALGLLCCYTLAIAVNLLRGRRSIDCGCGGEPTPLSAWMLLRNGVLIALAIIAGVLATSAVSTGTLALAVPAVLLLWLVYAIANQLLANQGVFHDRFGLSHG